jgi:Tfp pilus assembly protein PilN
MMRRLDIDFVRSASRSRWAGPVLLAVSLAAAAHAAATYADLRGSVREAEARLARVSPAHKGKKVSSEELAAAREAVQRLTLPWSALFGALESASSDQVALLAIEPDPRKGTVTISGDSKDYLAALTYVLELRRAGALESVELVRHELKSKDPQRPVHFSISATWAK